jgi:hypothetical protein
MHVQCSGGEGAALSATGGCNAWSQGCLQRGDWD